MAARTCFQPVARRSEQVGCCTPGTTVAAAAACWSDSEAAKSASGTGCGNLTDSDHTAAPVQAGKGAPAWAALSSAEGALEVAIESMAPSTCDP